MTVKKYGGSKFNGLREKERIYNLKPRSLKTPNNCRSSMSKKMTKEEEEELLEQFEKMLNGDEIDLDDDFGYFDPDNWHYPNDEDLEFPYEVPPPIPKKTGCSHKKWKKVFYTQNEDCKICINCKADLGYYKKEEEK